jgi:predicted Zn-dependent peptidase
MREILESTRLPNGLVVLSDRMQGLRSATLGFFYRVGSRNEPDELNGISHFIEHTVFKGTNRRSPLDIAIEMDRLGGSLEAFTTHEETGFIAKVIDEQVGDAFDLIADMLTDPLFDEEELKAECRVILEEIKMTEDSPEELLGEIFSRKFFPGHPLGMSIAGTPKTVRSFDSRITRRYHRRMYTPDNLIIAAAGNIDHSSIVALAEKYFGETPAATQKRNTRIRKPSYAAPVMIKRNVNLEQAQMIIATPFVSAADERRYAADLLTSILGGGTSSRLWQKIREERGLAYSVGASNAMFRDCGFFSVFAGTSPKQTEQVLDITIAELRKLVNNGVTTEELLLAKQQTIASILLGLEDSAGRAATLAQLEMTHGRQISLGETLSNIEAVTRDDIRQLAEEFFRTDRVAFAALGDLNGFRVSRKQLEI